MGASEKGVRKIGVRPEISGKCGLTPIPPQDAAIPNLSLKGLRMLLNDLSNSGDEGPVDLDWTISAAVKHRPTSLEQIKELYADLRPFGYEEDVFERLTPESLALDAKKKQWIDEYRIFRKGGRIVVEMFCSPPSKL